MNIKICGVTRAQDIEILNALPVWAIGLNNYAQSPRYVAPETMATLAQHIRPGILKVGVFVNAPRPHIQALIQSCGLDAIQLHGEESPDDCRGWSVPVIKAFRIAASGPLPDLTAYASVAYILIDAHSPQAYGGTGQRIADERIAGLSVSQPLILAGGITPSNARDLWERHHPMALDICSGVESAPGIKDPVKLRQLWPKATHV